MTIPSRLALALSATLGVAIAVGCGGGSDSSSSSTTPPPPPPASNAALNVHLTKEPVDDYTAVNVNLQKVEIHGASGWTTVATPNKTVDLLSLTGADSEALATNVSVPSGHYDAVRLTLGDGNSLTLKDGSTQPLALPAAFQGGSQATISLDAAANGTVDLWVDVDAMRSIQAKVGTTTAYTLMPVVTAIDKSTTGAISGQLLHENNSTAVPGTWVFAETLDANGQPHVVRAVRSDDAGNYKLDLLPLGQTYYVVAWALLPSDPHYLASDPIALSQGSPSATFDGRVKHYTFGGALVVNVGPLAAEDQTDVIFQAHDLDTPTSGAHTFIVRYEAAQLQDTQERYIFNYTPQGTYTALVERTKHQADGTVAVSSASQANITTDPNPATSSYVVVNF